MSIINFDARSTPPAMGFAPKPKGRYQVIISASSLEPTQDGSGKIIKFTCPIQGGVHHGQDILFNVTWENQNPKAVAIGHGQFSALCHAVNVLTPQMTEQLHNIPFMLDVDVTPDGKYQQIIAIEGIAGSTPQAQPAPPMPQPAPMAAPMPQAPPVALPPPPAPAPLPPAPVASFPPPGWLVHPQNPAYYYEAANPANMKTAAELQALPQAPAPMGNGLAGEVPSWIANQMGQ